MLRPLDLALVAGTRPVHGVLWIEDCAQAFLVHGGVVLVGRAGRVFAQGLEDLLVRAAEELRR
jgi:hypothetical protein